MKTRKVVVTVELETNLPIAILRNKDTWDKLGDVLENYDIAEIIQVQANVIKEGKEKKSKCCNM